MNKIDAHQHFWKYTPETHGWITDEIAVLRQDFLPETLGKHLQANGYEGCVAVQAAQTEAENEFLLGLADRYNFVKGVVGWVDLQSPKVEECLAKYAAHPKFCGIRHIVQDEPDDRFLLRKEFTDGIAKLRQFGLTYDVLIYVKHLSIAYEFVKQFPDQPFVLDHLAKPDIKSQEVANWSAGFRKLASFPNVCCKLSGMVTEADWQQWQASDMQPYLETALDAFGTDRLMIGSDWPVCKLAAEYDRAIAPIEQFVGTLSETEQRKILRENALTFYNIN